MNLPLGGLLVGAPQVRHTALRGTCRVLEYHLSQIAEHADATILRRITAALMWINGNPDDLYGVLRQFEAIRNDVHDLWGATPAGSAVAPEVFSADKRAQAACELVRGWMREAL